MVIFVQKTIIDYLYFEKEIYPIDFKLPKLL